MFVSFVPINKLFGLHPGQADVTIYDVIDVKL